MQTKIDCVNNTVTVTCGGAPCGQDAPTVEKKPQQTRRSINDLLVGEWVTHWQQGRTGLWISKKYGYAGPVVLENIYKHQMYAQAAKIVELEQEIKRLTLQNKKLREKNKGLS